MIHQRLGVRRQAAHGAPDVLVNLCHFVDAAWLLSVCACNEGHAAMSFTPGQPQVMQLQDVQPASRQHVGEGEGHANHAHYSRCRCSVLAVGVGCHTPPTSSGDVMRFSTASTTPSLVKTPMAVDPSCGQILIAVVRRRQLQWRLPRQPARPTCVP
jgi:hypothetical protein